MRRSRGWAAWALCEACEDWYCRVHAAHVSDCPCPSPQHWKIDPREAGSYMARKSREKGKRGERELAEALRNLGVQARRGVQFAGGPESPDVVSDLPVHWECKRSETFQPYQALAQASAEAPEGVTPVVAHRRNGKQWIAVLDLAAFVRIVQGAIRFGRTETLGGGQSGRSE